MGVIGGKKFLNFTTEQSNGWHFLISKRPKDISQQGFYIYAAISQYY